ncbi:MAG: transketolase C-terminal domain-containing protein [Patescibacteria group bacterium]
MRNAFVKTLTELVHEDPHIMVITGDLGFNVFDEFKVQYPDRYLNIGVSEANMIGVAAGLALEGKIVYVYSIIPFATMRCFEQIRNDLCYQNLNVNIVGVGGGYSYSYFGATHHAIEDISIMRTLPRMTVICPGDPWETSEAVRAVANLPGPTYLRLGKRGEPTVHKPGTVFTVGKGIIIEEGTDVTLIATSTMLEGASQTVQLLKAKGVSPMLVSIHTIKPLDVKLLRDIAQRLPAIVTLEEHSIFGGLGSAVAEVLAESPFHPRFKRIGVLDSFPDTIGTQIYLRGKHGLNPEQICEKVLELIGIRNKEYGIVGDD